MAWPRNWARNSRNLSFICQQICSSHSIQAFYCWAAGPIVVEQLCSHYRKLAKEVSCSDCGRKVPRNGDGRKGNNESWLIEWASILRTRDSLGYSGSYGFSCVHLCAHRGSKLESSRLSFLFDEARAEYRCGYMADWEISAIVQDPTIEITNLLPWNASRLTIQSWLEQLFHTNSSADNLCILNRVLSWNASTSN